MRATACTHFGELLVHYILVVNSKRRELAVVETERFLLVAFGVLAAMLAVPPSVIRRH